MLPLESAPCRGIDALCAACLPSRFWREAGDRMTTLAGKQHGSSYAGKKCPLLLNRVFMRCMEIQGTSFQLIAMERTCTMEDLTSDGDAVSRRHVLQTIVSGMVVGVAAQFGSGLVCPPQSHAQSSLSPDEAVQELLAGNQRTCANQLTSIQHDLTVLREHTVDKQEPFAGILACADSRVPVELVFDQTIGRLFVTRVAGNMVTPEVIAGLEYCVAVLGIKALLVLGHSGCGAVKAAMNATAVPGQISALYQHLQPGVTGSRGNLDKAIQANARVQAELLRMSSLVIREAIKAGKLRVEAAVYDLSTGKVAMT